MIINKIKDIKSIREKNSLKFKLTSTYISTKVFNVKSVYTKEMVDDLQLFSSIDMSDALLKELKSHDSKL